MLGHTYRYQAQNETGGSVTVTVKDRRRKFAGGARVDAAESTPMNGVAVGASGYGNGSTVDNSGTSDLWLGADLQIIFAPGASVTGAVTLRRQVSSDGGATWPSDGKGEFITAHRFSASSTAVTLQAVVD